MATIELTPTGSADNIGINLAILGATLGDKLFFRDGVYDIASFVAVNKYLECVGESMDGVIMRASSSFSASSLWLTTADDCVMSNMTFDGQGAIAANESQGPAFQRVNNLIVENVRSRNFRGHQFMLYSAVGGTVSNLVTDTAAGTLTGTSHGLDIDVNLQNVSNATWSGGVATITIPVNHKHVVGGMVLVKDINPSGYNGIYQITAVNAPAGTLSYALVSNPGAYVSGGTTGRETSGITFNDCNLYNGWSGAGRQCLKAENCNGLVFNRANLRSQWALGDPTLSDVGVQVNDSTVDGVCILSSRTSNFPLIVQDSTFTRDGGAILIRGDSGSALQLLRNTVPGRNYWMGHNGTTWTAASNVIERNTVRPDRQIGKTLFASYISTGQEYNVAPYCTPNTARNNFEDLVRETVLVEQNIHYALLSDRGTHFVPSDETAMTLGANVVATVEGYPGVATVNVGATTADWANFTQMSPGSRIQNFHITGGRGASQQAMRFSDQASTTIGCDVLNVEVSDFVNTAIGSAIEVRGGTAGGGTTVTARGCKFHGISGTVAGQVCYVQAGTAPATLIIEGTRIEDNSTTNAGVVRCGSAANTTLRINGSLVANNTAGTTGVIYNQGASTEVNGTAFVGNTGVNGRDIHSTQNMNVRGSIFELNANLGGAGAFTLTRCLVGDGIGSHTDGGGNVTGVPTYTDAANDDYTLTENSAGVKAGHRWWTPTGRRPIGINNEPFGDIELDCGPSPSRHSIFHPAKR